MTFKEFCRVTSETTKESIKKNGWKFVVGRLLLLPFALTLFLIGLGLVKIGKTIEKVKRYLCGLW